MPPCEEITCHIGKKAPRFHLGDGNGFNINNKELPKTNPISLPAHYAKGRCKIDNEPHSTLLGWEAYRCIHMGKSKSKHTPVGGRTCGTLKNFPSVRLDRDTQNAIQLVVGEAFYLLILKYIIADCFVTHPKET